MWSVFFVLLSYLDRNLVKADFLSRALDVERQGKEMFSMLNDTLCAKMSTLGENFLYQVSDGTEAVSSVVSPTGTLVDCSVTLSQMEVKSFMRACTLELKGRRDRRQLETRFARLDEAKMMCGVFKERPQRSGVAQTDNADVWDLQHEPLKRSKRGFTYPGTLWCGLGNLADDYDQLGDFAETDSCCRTHDHCPHVIHPWSSNYGQTNLKLHSISHCDCDNALKNCLRKVNDTSSRVVGQAFFNVIGAPCFEFVYEERCAELHWYGLCKRYEMFPIAVLKEAVTYDFGGIDIIDELPVAPPRKKDSEKGQEEEKQESAPPSTASGPEEPSLTNVVTAAEDFIKVLATVSTSQSSTADSDRGDTQSSEKKKRKNSGKKRKSTKKQKGKGKGRRRKQKSEASRRIGGGAAVSPSGSKAEEVVAPDNFINESHRRDQPSRNRYGLGDGTYESGNKEGSPNEVMKDEPVMDEESVSVTAKVQKKPAESDGNGRQRQERRRKKKLQDTNTTDDLINSIYIPATVTITPPQTVPCAVSSPTATPRVETERSKQRDGRERRKTRRKVSSVSPIVAADRENSSTDAPSAIPPTGAPTVPSVPTAEGGVPRRPEAYGGKMAVEKTPYSSTGVSKRQRLKGGGLRGRRRKTVLPFPSENPPFRNGADNILPIPTRAVWHSPADATAAGRLLENAQTLAEQGLSTAAAPSVSVKRREHTVRRQRKTRQRAVHAAPPMHPERSPESSTVLAGVGAAEGLRSKELYPTTTAAPAAGPVRSSVERAEAQFGRKKRKKAARSLGQQ